MERDMAKEYKEDAIVLKNHISKLRKIYSREIALNDFKVCKRISLLYDMYLEMNHIGNFLYKRQEGNKNLWQN